MSVFLDAHYRQVARAFLDGRIVPLLGTGVNLCGRPADVGWQQGCYLSSGAELAAHLADYFDYPSGELEDLLRVSEYVSAVTSEGPLYDELYKLFDADYPPTQLHRLLAALPAMLRKAGAARYPMIVTTNYDDALERAFQEVGEAFDLVVYIAEGDASGKFLHCAPDGKSQLIDRPTKYAAILLKQRPVIFKFVITEDHYIDHLTRSGIANLVPVPLVVTLRRSHFLFLGYRMQDLDLQIKLFLHSIWGQQTLSYKSWAVQVDPDRIEQEFWHKRDVYIIKVRLEDYVAGLSDHLQGVLQEQVS